MHVMVVDYISSYNQHFSHSQPYMSYVLSCINELQKHRSVDDVMCYVRNNEFVMIIKLHITTGCKFAYVYYIIG